MTDYKNERHRRVAAGINEAIREALRIEAARPWRIRLTDNVDRTLDQSLLRLHGMRLPKGITATSTVSGSVGWKNHFCVPVRRDSGIPSLAFMVITASPGVIASTTCFAVTLCASPTLSGLTHRRALGNPQVSPVFRPGNRRLSHRSFSYRFGADEIRLRTETLRHC